MPLCAYIYEWMHPCIPTFTKIKSVKELLFVEGRLGSIVREMNEFFFTVRIRGLHEHSSV